MNQDKLVKRFIIGTFVTLYVLVSVISTIHVIDFFELSNPYWLAVTLAIGFEVGAAASLASLVILDKTNKGLVWALFITITLMQVQGNMFYAFKNLKDFQTWSELFNLIEEDVIYQKRVLSLVSGAILPLVALGFIKSLVDYIKPKEEDDELEVVPGDSSFNSIKEEIKQESAEEIKEEIAEEDLFSDLTHLDKSIGNDQELEFDESHELDKVINEMVEDEELSDYTDENIDDIDDSWGDWEEVTNDGLEDEENGFDGEEDEEVKPNEELLEASKKYLEWQKQAADNIVQNQVEQDEDPLLAAKRKLGKEKMKGFLKK